MPGVDVHVPVQRHDIQHPFRFVPGEYRIEVSSFDGHADVLHDEIAPGGAGSVYVEHQSPPFQSGVEDRERFPFLALDAFVAAEGVAGTVGGTFLLAGVEGAGGVDAGRGEVGQVGLTEARFGSFVFGSGGFFQVGHVQRMIVDVVATIGMIVAAVVGIGMVLGLVAGPFDVFDVNDVGG